MRAPLGATSSFPLIAARIGEIRAMAGKSPAVVQSPYNTTIRSNQPFKQFINIQIVTMEVVQVNHVRTELIKTMNQRVGLPHRMKAHLTVKESKTNVKYKISR